MTDSSRTRTAWTAACAAAFFTLRNVGLPGLSPAIQVFSSPLSLASANIQPSLVAIAIAAVFRPTWRPRVRPWATLIVCALVSWFNCVVVSRMPAPPGVVTLSSLPAAFGALFAATIFLQWIAAQSTARGLIDGILFIAAFNELFNLVIVVKGLKRLHDALELNVPLFVLFTAGLVVAANAVAKARLGDRQLYGLVYGTLVISILAAALYLTGIPTTLQGWAVLAAIAALVASCTTFLNDSRPSSLKPGPVAATLAAISVAVPVGFALLFQYPLSRVGSEAFRGVEVILVAAVAARLLQARRLSSTI